MNKSNHESTTGTKRTKNSLYRSRFVKLRDPRVFVVSPFLVQS